MRPFNLLSLILLLFSAGVNSLMAAEDRSEPFEVKLSAYYSTEGVKYLRSESYEREASCGSAN